MHELGHNLGLKHGGDNHGNRKPNYLSIMNYAFQMRGLKIGGADGNSTLPLLAACAERIRAKRKDWHHGRGRSGRLWHPLFDSSATDRIVNDINGPIDWNGNGVSTNDPVAVNVNNEGGLTVLNNSDNSAELCSMEARSAISARPSFFQRTIAECITEARISGIPGVQGQDQRPRGLLASTCRPRPSPTRS